MSVCRWLLVLHAIVHSQYPFYTCFVFYSKSDIFSLVYCFFFSLLLFMNVYGRWTDHVAYKISYRLFVLWSLLNVSECSMFSFFLLRFCFGRPNRKERQPSIVDNEHHILLKHNKAHTMHTYISLLPRVHQHNTKQIPLKIIKLILFQCSMFGVHNS